MQTWWDWGIHKRTSNKNEFNWRFKFQQSLNAKATSNQMKNNWQKMTIDQHLATHFCIKHMSGMHGKACFKTIHEEQDKHCTGWKQWVEKSLAACKIFPHHFQASEHATEKIHVCPEEWTNWKQKDFEKKKTKTIHSCVVIDSLPMRKPTWTWNNPDHNLYIASVVWHCFQTLWNYHAKQQRVTDL